MKHVQFWVLLVSAACTLAGEMTGTLSFQIQEMQFSTREGYSRISVPGCVSFGSPGEPLLPVRPVTLVLPAGACNVAVVASVQSGSVSPASGVLQPAAVPRPFSMVTEVAEIIAGNPEIYRTDSFWPGETVGNVRVGNKGGFTLVSFLVYPVQYNPVSRELQTAESVEYAISWASGASACVSPGQVASSASQLAGWVDNPQDILFNAPVATGRDAVDLLVITTGDYSDSFTAFTAFKNTQGIQTELVFVSDILSSSSGYDDAEKLRNYIISRYTSDGLKYVLLAGDQTVVPARNVNLSCEGYTDTAPADLYYSDLDGTWDASGDHNYGQTNDNLDLYGDISVGRALFDNADEAALFVQRTIMYESSPPAGGWQTRAMLCGAGLFTGYTGAKVCDSIAVNLPGGWDINKAYETAKYADGYTTPTDIINSGTNWVHYAGHGNTTGIYWQGSPSSMMTNSIAQSLSNGNMAGIHHSIGCHPGAFQSGECCAEALWHNGNGGAVSVMFNTSYGWEGNVPEMGISEWMCVYITEEVFQLGNTMIGEAFATSKDRRVPFWTGGYDRELYCLMDWHGYHDPTLVPAGCATGIAEEDHALFGGNSVSLGTPWPNPVVSGSAVAFAVSLMEGSGELSIYDVSGRQVMTESVNASGTVLWNTDSSGGVAPGVYFARLMQGSTFATRKIVVTR